LDCAVDSFGNSILRWHVCIGFFMMDSLLNKVHLESVQSLNGGGNGNNEH
jgi:hypothetical protein